MNSGSKAEDGTDYNVTSRNGLDPKSSHITRLIGLLGMARRAGRLVMGYDAVVSLVREGKAYGIYTACDLSEKTMKELRFSLDKYEAKVSDPVILPLPKYDLSAALGAQKPVGIIALSDKGFAAAAKKLADECLEESRI